MDDQALRLAVPNKGRLREPALRLLREAGLAFEQTERALSVKVRNADIDLLFVRTEDVVELVADGVASLGITGLDLLEESGRPTGSVRVLLSLGFGRCELTVAAPTGADQKRPEDFAGLRIATSHPNLTQRYFNGRGVPVDVVLLRGSVEVAPKLGVADAVADLVSTGSTLMVNGLRPVLSILKSEAVLVGGPPRPDNPDGGRYGDHRRRVGIGRTAQTLPAAQRPPGNSSCHNRPDPRPRSTHRDPAGGGWHGGDPLGGGEGRGVEPVTPAEGGRWA